MSKKKERWKTFFSKEIGEAMFHPISQATTVQEVERILKAARPQPGTRILDIGCGIGRHSLELAKRGFDVVGLDFSGDYLALANQAKKRNRLPNLQFVQGDMRKIDRYFPAASFGLVVCLQNTFSCLDDRQDGKQLLARIARALEPGGALVLNVSNGSGVEYHWRELAEKFDYPDLLYWKEFKAGSFYLERFIYSPNSQRASMECVVFTAGRGVQRFSLGTNIYPHEWFVSTLKPLGLKIESKWERLGTQREFHKRGWQQSFVARKSAAKNN